MLTGYGATGFGDTCLGEIPTAVTVKRAGLNRLDAYFDDLEIELGFDFDNGDPAQNVLSALGHESDLGLGADEVLTAAGDSGGPAFLDQSIAGVFAFGTVLNAFDFNDKHDRSWGEAGFATRVSSFRDFITEATNGEAVFVPEPGFALSGWWCVLLLLARLRTAMRRVPRIRPPCYRNSLACFTTYRAVITSVFSLLLYQRRLSSSKRDSSFRHKRLSFR